MTLDIIAYREFNMDRPFAPFHSRGPKPPCWDAKVALGQDQQKAYIIIKKKFLCLSCTSATFASQHGGFVPREWKAAKGLLRQHSLHPGCILATTEKMIGKSWKAEKEPERKFKGYILISNRLLEQSCYLILVFKICFKSTVIFSKVTQLLRNETWWLIYSIEYFLIKPNSSSATVKSETCS